MLGEQIGEFKGKVTGTRILPDGKYEASGEGPGKILDIDASLAFTGIISPLQNGNYLLEGNSIITTKDGETVLANGRGVIHPTGKGEEAKESGEAYLTTQSQKFIRLNDIISLYEQESEENGDWSMKIWEWTIE